MISKKKHLLEELKAEQELGEPVEDSESSDEVPCLARLPRSLGVESQRRFLPDYIMACHKPAYSRTGDSLKLNPELKPEPFVSQLPHLLFEDRYEEWTSHLTHGLNLLLYGPGSKHGVLEAFAKWLVKQHRVWVVEVEAFQQGFTVKRLLSELLGSLNDLQPRVQSVDSIFPKVLSGLSESEAHLHIVVHNLDADGMKTPDAHEFLSRLASHSHVRLLASMDNPYTFTDWTPETRLRYQFSLIPIATYAPYKRERRHQAKLQLFGKRAVYAQLKGFSYLLKSMTPTQRNILDVLANKQVTQRAGLSMKEFSAQCVEAMLAVHSRQVKDALVEARDHRLITYKSDPTGSLTVSLTIDPVSMLNLLAKFSK